MGRRGHRELEAQVMHVLGEQSEPVGAGVIQEQLPDPLPAYTTVLTVLERLEQKWQVVRSSDSPRKVCFRAARSGDEHAGSTMIDAPDDAPGSPGRTAALRGQLVHRRCRGPGAGTGPEAITVLPAVVALLGGAALLVLTAPHALTVGTWHVRHPRTALTLWFIAFFGGCAWRWWRSACSSSRQSPPLASAPLPVGSP